MTFNDYIHDLIRYGRCCFTIEHAQRSLGKTRKAILSSIEHLLVKGELASPARGFYVIIPPEYQILGCIPPEQFTPYLMEYWHCRYYVSLLTAASYHGTAHQAVQVFQVMTERHRPSITCNKVKIRFVTNQHLSNTPTQTIATLKSMLILSTPEGTAMDLLNYSEQSGGLNHIATVLSELQEVMNTEKLLSLAESHSELAWKQRLGYLLDKVGADELAHVLKTHLAQQKRIDYIKLMPGLKKFTEIKRNATWKIIENITIESDL